MTGSGRGSGQGSMMEEVTFSLIGGDLLHWNIKCRFTGLGLSRLAKGNVGKNSVLIFFIFLSMKTQLTAGRDDSTFPPPFTCMIMSSIVEQAFGPYLMLLFLRVRMCLCHMTQGCEASFPSGWLWRLSILQILNSGLDSQSVKGSVALKAPNLLMWEIIPVGVQATMGFSYGF